MITASRHSTGRMRIRGQRIMHEHQTNTNVPIISNPPSSDHLSESWRSVGVQLQQLGSRLAMALRRGWMDSHGTVASTAMMQDLRDDLHNAASQVDNVIQDISRDALSERDISTRATRFASEQSLEEVRILTVATLRKLNRQLDELAERLEDTAVLHERP
jgi:hypothetical protein